LVEAYFSNCSKVTCITFSSEFYAFEADTSQRLSSQLDDDGDFYSVTLAFRQTTGKKRMGVSEMA
jgi:hypothetical protein